MSLLSKVAVSALACAALAGPAAAQQPAAPPAQPTAAEPDVGDVSTGSHIIVYGAMKDPSDRAAPVAEDRNVPMLPVVYEDASPSRPAAAAPPASPARR